jgi:hypothetical protein
MNSDAHKLKNSLGAPPNQLPAFQHCLVGSQGRGPDYVSTLYYSSFFEGVHHV